MFKEINVIKNSNCSILRTATILHSISSIVFMSIDRVFNCLFNHIKWPRIAGVANVQSTFKCDLDEAVVFSFCLSLRNHYHSKLLMNPFINIRKTNLDHSTLIIHRFVSINASIALVVNVEKIIIRLR